MHYVNIASVPNLCDSLLLKDVNNIKDMHSKIIFMKSLLVIMNNLKYLVRLQY